MFLLFHCLGWPPQRLQLYKCWVSFPWLLLLFPYSFITFLISISFCLLLAFLSSMSLCFPCVHYAFPISCFLLFLSWALPTHSSSPLILSLLELFTLAFYAYGPISKKFTAKHSIMPAPWQNCSGGHMSPIGKFNF